MSDPAAGFELDPQLERDTIVVGDLPLCRVLLMDDARWPWLILVPRRAGVRELFELNDDDQVTLVREVSQAGSALMALSRGEKLNVAALGNVVPQLHVHLVARRSDDPAWPNVVWGLFPRQHYQPEAMRDMLPRVADSLGLPEPD
jgi:diadenosine tetraphosphate (Ap4A) HIT family hydrolase